MVILIRRASKVFGRFEFWITLKEYPHWCTKDVLQHSYHNLFLSFLFQSFLTIRWPGIENVSSGKPQSSLLSLTRNISKMSLNNFQTESNLFSIEIIFSPTKMFLGFYSSHVSQFLRASALESFFLMHGWDSDFSDLFLYKFVLLTGA